jgi:hypothetical protein
MTKHMTLEEKNQRRARHFSRAMQHRVEGSLRDKVKAHIVQYAVDNPDWTPEALKLRINQLLREYGLHNRYLPPEFKKPEEVPSAPDIQPNAAGVEAAANQPA